LEGQFFLTAQSNKRKQQKDTSQNSTKERRNTIKKQAKITSFVNHKNI